MWPKFDVKKSDITTQKRVKINKVLKCFVFSKMCSHILLKFKH